MKQIENEYILFKEQMLSKNNAEIYDNCNTILFYQCLYEYFIYSTDLNNVYISACLKCDNILSALYKVYTTYEYLRFERWEDIDELLNAFAGASDFAALNADSQN